MPRLMSSVVLVLVLLVWEGEAWFEPILRHDFKNKCRMVAGDFGNSNDRVLKEKTVRGSYYFIFGLSKKVNIPSFFRSFDDKITFIEVYDKNCERSRVVHKKFAEIKEGGVGVHRVEIKLDIFERKNYEFVIIVRGKHT